MERCFCGKDATRVYEMKTVVGPYGRIPICDGHEFEKCAGTITPLSKATESAR